MLGIFMTAQAGLMTYADEMAAEEVTPAADEIAYKNVLLKDSGFVYTVDGGEADYSALFDGDTGTFVSVENGSVVLEFENSIKAEALYLAPRTVVSQIPEVTSCNHTGGSEECTCANIIDVHSSPWFFDGDVMYEDAGAAQVMFEYNQAYSAEGYRIVIPEGTPEENVPTGWDLFGKNENSDAVDWMYIDSLSDVMLETGENVFSTEKKPAYQYYMFQITGASESGFTIGSLELFFNDVDSRSLEELDYINAANNTILEGSDDGTNWSTVYEFSSSIVSRQGWYVKLDSAADTSYKYFRLRNTTEENNMLELAEFCIYRAESEPEPEPEPEPENKVTSGNLTGTIEDENIGGGAEALFDDNIYTYVNTSCAVFRSDVPVELTGVDIHPAVELDNTSTESVSGMEDAGKTITEQNREFADTLNGMKIQGSADGETWITLYRINGGVEPAQVYSIDSDMLGSAASQYQFTYFRVLGDCGNMCIAEVDFFGNAGSSAEEFPAVIENVIYSVVDYSDVMDWDEYNFGDAQFLEDDGNGDTPSVFDYFPYDKPFSEDEGFQGQSPVMILDAVYPAGFDGNLVIPDTLEIAGFTRPVLGIAPKAFANEDQLKSVSFGNYMRYVCDYAFGNTDGLTTVKINNSLRFVSDTAFILCGDLLRFERIGEPLTHMQKELAHGNFVDVFDDCLYAGDILTAVPMNKHADEDFRFETDPDKNPIRAIGSYAMMGTKASAVHFPDFICEIGDCALADSATLSQVNLPADLEYIGGEAFRYTQIEALVIPENVRHIAGGIIKGCDKLTDISIHAIGDVVIDKNAFYTDENKPEQAVDIHCYAGTEAEQQLIVHQYRCSSIEGQKPVYTTYEAVDGLHLGLVVHNGNEVFEIPYGVNVIDGGAFRYFAASQITSVKFPETLTKICSGAFRGKLAENATVTWSGAVPLNVEDGAFDFEVDEVCDGEILVDGILYLYEYDTYTASVTGYWFDAIDAGGKITVPAKVGINGKEFDVISVHDRAFTYSGIRKRAGAYFAKHGINFDWDASRRDLVYVVLPESVIYIGNNAFADNNTIKGITLPANIRVIEDNDMIFNALALEEINGLDAYGTGSSRYKTVDGMVIDTYADDMVIFYPARRTDADVNIPSGIAGIRNGAFARNGNITHVNLPSSLSNISGQAFIGCGNIASFALSEQNKNYRVFEDGTLRNYKGDHLVAYPPAGIPGNGSLQLPDGLRSIGSGAVNGSSVVKEIIVPESVVHIRDRAFNENDNLAKIRILGTLEKPLNVNAVEKNQSLSNFDYLGEKLDLFWYENEDFAIRYAKYADGRDRLEGDSFVYGEKTKLTIRDDFGENKDQECDLRMFTIRDNNWDDPDCRTEINVSDNPYFTKVVGDEEVYRITYDANGGEYDPVTQHKYMNGTVMITTEVPGDKNGRVFLGWAAEESSETVAYTGGDVYTENADLHLTAVWAKLYTVEYDANGGTNVPETVTVIEGQTVTIPDAEPVREGYVFMGWSDVREEVNSASVKYGAGSEYSPRTEKATLYAVWAEIYTVTYNANSGINPPASQNATVFDTVTVSDAEPVREGYIFKGWNDSREEAGIGEVRYTAGSEFSIQEDITLYAVWAKICTVTFDANSCTGEYKTLAGRSDEKYVIPEEIGFVRENYILFGWSETNDALAAEYLPGQEIILSGDLTLYAVWEKNVFTITYDANGGEVAPDTQSFVKGETVTITDAEPVREGYIFKGWNNSREEADNSAANSDFDPGREYTSAEDITLFAVWAKIYTVTYNANGGSSAPETQTKAGSEEIRITEDEPVFVGYKFLGWSISDTSLYPDGAYNPGASYSAEEDLTLYAVWAEIFTITYDANDGSGRTETETTYENADYFISGDIVFEREGYIFLGWATDSGAVNAEFEAGDKVYETGDVTLFAVWEEEAIDPDKAVQISVTDTAGRSGGEAAVEIMLDHNPGIAGLKFEVVFDESVMTLIGCEQGEALNGFRLVSDGANSGSCMIVFSGTDESGAVGSLVTLIFRIADHDEEREYNIEINIPDRNGIFDGEQKKIPALVSNGKLTVVVEKNFGDIFAFADTSVVYNGTNQTPELILKEGAIKPCDYTVSYSMSPRNCGTYTVSAVVQADGYKPKVLDTGFTITKATADFTIASVEAKVGDGYELAYTCEGIAGTDSAAGTPAVETDGSAGEYPITQGSLRIIDGETGKTSQNYDIEINADAVLTLINVPDTSISLNMNRAELKEGESVQLAAIFTPANTTVRDITWTSSNSNVTVENGLVTANDFAGDYSTAIVAAESAAGNTAFCEVTVVCRHHLELINAVSATCSENGSIAYYACSGCGKMFGDHYASEELAAADIATAVDPSNHAYDTAIEGEKEPAEDADGFTGDVVCTGCYKIVKAGTAIPALAHQHTGITYHEASEATCLRESSAEYWTCSSSKCRGIYYGDAQCRSILHIVVTAKNPDHHTKGTELVRFKQVTCTENGYTGDTVYSCCGMLVSDGRTEIASGHQASDVWIIENEVHYKVCSVCHCEVMKSAHASSSAACTEDAVCAVCGYVTEEAKGHNLGTMIAETPVGCTTAGIMKHWKCSDCSKLFADEDGTLPAAEEGVRIAPKGHIWGEWSEKSDDSYVIRHCVVCSDASESRKVIEISDADSGLTFDLYRNESDQTADLEIRLTTSTLTGTGEGEVKIDVSNIGSGAETLAVKQISIPTEAIESVADTLAVELTTGSVAFSGDALSTLTESDGSVSLRVEPVGENGGDIVSYLKDGMNYKQVNTLNDTLSGREVLGAVDLSLALVSVGQNTSLGSYTDGGFGRGSATVSVPFTPKDSDRTEYKMVYIHEDGTAEEADALYADGKLMFTVNHFSQFIVVEPLVKGAADAAYALLSTAVDACDDNGIVRLLGNISETVVIEKNLIIVKDSFTADNIKAGEGFVLSIEDDRYVISKAAASIDNHYFASLSEAAANAANGRTIRLYESYTGETLKIGKPIRIMLEDGAEANVKADAAAGIIEKFDGNTYTFVKAAAVIESAEQKLYETIADAVGEAADGAIIKLLKSSDEEIILNKPVVIDLNGFTTGEIRGGSGFQEYGDRQITVHWKAAENTAAGKYAAILFGDTDADNVLEESDITLLQDYFAGKASEDDAQTVEENLNRLDVDGNGKLSRRDLMILSRYLEGWDGYDKLPYEAGRNNR